MRPHAPRGWYLLALRTLELDSCPSTIRYRIEPAAPRKVDFTNYRRISALAILELADPPMRKVTVHPEMDARGNKNPKAGMFKCWRYYDTEAYGHMRDHYEGKRWEQIPECLRGRVAQAIKEFRRELEKEGYDLG